MQNEEKNNEEKENVLHLRVTHQIQVHKHILLHSVWRALSGDPIISESASPRNVHKSTISSMYLTLWFVNHIFLASVIHY